MAGKADSGPGWRHKTRLMESAVEERKEREREMVVGGAIKMARRWAGRAGWLMCGRFDSGAAGDVKAEEEEEALSGGGDEAVDYHRLN